MQIRSRTKGDTRPGPEEEVRLLTRRSVVAPAGLRSPPDAPRRRGPVHLPSDSRRRQPRLYTTIRPARRSPDATVLDVRHELSNRRRHRHRAAVVVQPQRNPSPIRGGRGTGRGTRRGTRRGTGRNTGWRTFKRGLDSSTYTIRAGRILEHRTSPQYIIRPRPIFRPLAGLPSRRASARRGAAV